LQLGISADEEVKLYKATGCQLCEGSGFYGRIGIYEILTVSPEIKRLIATNATTEQIRDTAISQGMKTLRQSTAEYVIAGGTTISEMQKVSVDV